MAGWTCTICKEQGTDLGSYVKTGGAKTHLKCYGDLLVKQAITMREHEESEQKALALRKQEDDAKARKAAQLAELINIRARGKDLWTREDRQRLVEARLICVHCGTNLRPTGTDVPGVPGSGEMRKHCSPCYMARDFGEGQAAAAASKSADGIAAVGAELAKLAGGESKPAQPAEPAKKDEAKPAPDRFSLIDLD